MERVEGRDEPRRAEATPAGIPGPVHVRAGSPPRSQAGDYRLGSDQRKKRPQLGGKIPPRYLVRRALELGTRRENYLEDRAKRVETEGHFTTWPRDDAGVHGK